MQMCGTWTVGNPQFIFVTWLLVLSVPVDATKYSQADPHETVEANAPILTPDAHPDPEPCSPTPMRETRRSIREIKPTSRYCW